MTEPKKLFVNIKDLEDIKIFDGIREATEQDLKDLGYIKVEPKMPIGEYLTKLIQGGLDAGRDAETIGAWCWAFFVDLEPNMKSLGWVKAEDIQEAILDIVGWVDYHLQTEEDISLVDFKTMLEKRLKGDKK